MGAATSTQAHEEPPETLSLELQVRGEAEVQTLTHAVLLCPPHHHFFPPCSRHSILVCIVRPLGVWWSSLACPWRGVPPSSLGRLWRRRWRRRRRRRWRVPQLTVQVPVEDVITTAIAAGKAILNIYNSEVG